MNDSKFDRGTLYLFASATLWSFAGVLTKYIPFGPMTIACFRCILAGLVQLLIARPRKLVINRAVLLTAFCYFGEALTFIYANKFTTSGNAIVLQNTSPLCIILFGLLIYKQKPTRLECLSGVAIFGGILLSLAGSMRGGGMLGDMLALVSAVFYAGIFFCSRLPGAQPLHSTILANLANLLLLPFALRDPVLHDPALSTTPIGRAWAAMVFMGIVQMGLSWLLFSKGIRLVPALRANFLVMIEPVLSPIWARLVLGERMSTLGLIGAAIVLVSVTVYNVLSLRTSENKPAPPAEAA